MILRIKKEERKPHLYLIFYPVKMVKFNQGKLFIVAEPASKSAGVHLSHMVKNFFKSLINI